MKTPKIGAGKLNNKYIEILLIPIEKRRYAIESFVITKSSMLGLEVLPN